MQVAGNAVNGAMSLLAGKLASRAAGRLAGKPIDICTGSTDIRRRKTAFDCHRSARPRATPTYQHANLTGRTTSWGLDEQRAIDSSGRVVAHSIRNSLNDHSEQRRRTYTYDAESNLATLGDSCSGFRIYGYDLASRLISMSGRNGEKTLAYRHDACGNLVRLPDGGSTVVNRGNRIVRAGETVYRYDNFGRLTEKAFHSTVTRFYYDPAGLLKKVCHPDGTATFYCYDSYRRRISKRHGDTTTHYLWESDRLVGELVEHRRHRCYIYGRKEDLVPCAFTEYSRKGDAWEGWSYAIHFDHIGTPFSIPRPSRG